MNSSLRDFQNSFLGRQFVKIIISQFKKHVAKDSPNFSFMLNEMLNMPFRGVISWANNDALSYKNGLVILDILNGKYIKGVKAFFKK